MSFPAHSLVAAGGSLYSHVFENASTGLERGHFCHSLLDFDPLEYDENEWDCSVMVEWSNLLFAMAVAQQLARCMQR